MYSPRQAKEREYNRNLEKDIKERENQQNKQFLDSIQKDKQVNSLKLLVLALLTFVLINKKTKSSYASALRTQMGVTEAGKMFERNDYTKKVQEAQLERKNLMSDYALERQERLKKQKEYKLTLDQQVRFFQPARNRNL